MTLADLFQKALNDAETLARLAKTDRTLPPETRTAILRSALVMAMAAVDKILHEAVSKHFAYLAMDGELDDLVKINLSTMYKIALAARKRSGKGGSVKRRPGHDIKTEVLAQIYRDTFLSTQKLQKVCCTCGKDKIFKRFATRRAKSEKSDKLQSRWGRVYQRRNQIAHECDIERKEKTRSARFLPVSEKQLNRDINFIRHFGKFLAEELQSRG